LPVSRPDMIISTSCARIFDNFISFPPVPILLHSFHSFLQHFGLHDAIGEHADFGRIPCRTTRHALNKHVSLPCGKLLFDNSSRNNCINKFWIILLSYINLI
jgi:hypothetical protein